MTDQEWIDLTVGTKNPNYQCKRYDKPNEDCDKWEYDHSFYKSTIISEVINMKSFQNLLTINNCYN